MKKLLCAALSLMLLCGLLPAALAEEGLQDAYCAAQDFSTKIPDSLTAEWEEGSGLRIWLKAPGYVPNILIWRRGPEAKFNNPVNYLNNVYREHMEELYDGNVGTNPCQTVEMGGKTVYMARYHYVAGGNKLVMTRVIEIRDGGDVEFAAKYAEDDPDECLRVLETVVRWYTEGSAPASAEKEPAPKLATAAYGDGRFHIELPVGWQIMPESDYTTFCFKAWDPANPNRTMFFFMKLEPFLKGQAAKNVYVEVAKTYSLYELYASAPAMEGCTLKAFLEAIPDTYAFAEKWYDSGLTINPGVLPQIANPKIIRTAPSPLMAPATCGENLVAAITFEDYLGQPCEGCVTAQPVDNGSYDFFGVDGMPYSVYLFTGFTAPRGELDGLAPTLSACLDSFSFEEAYVKKTVDISNDQKEALLAVGREMQAVHDAMVEAWLAR